LASRSQKKREKGQSALWGKNESRKRENSVRGKYIRGRSKAFNLEVSTAKHFATNKHGKRKTSQREIRGYKVQKKQVSPRASRKHCLKGKEENEIFASRRKN